MAVLRRSFLSLLCTVTLFTALLAAPTADDPIHLEKRDPAIQDSPSGGYAPTRTQCPAGLRVRRPAFHGRLAHGEERYLDRKAAANLAKWHAYLARAGFTQQEIEDVLPVRTHGDVAHWQLPSVGIAVSGGALRSLLFGAGVLNAFDEGNPDALDARTGGVLQLSNYISGLSGGGWLVASWYLQNNPSLSEYAWPGLDLGEPLNLPRQDTPDEFGRVMADLKSKMMAGFNATAVDIYGRILAYHLINDQKHGAATLFSSMRYTDHYHKADLPFPIVISTSRRPSGATTLTDPIYEFTPEEFGTFHPSLDGGAFIPIDYMGTRMTKGGPSEKGAKARGRTSHVCVEGLDNAGFVLGATANMFGTPEGDAIYGQMAQIPGVGPALSQLPNVKQGVVPNPFKDIASGFPQRFQDDLFLADGGLAEENVPLWPLQSRNVDVIIALDASNDEDNYPDGRSLWMTWHKSQLPSMKRQYGNFPAIPPDFNLDNLRDRPSFFGCHGSGPLVVYLPNYQNTAATNTSTYQFQYSEDQVDQFFDNSFAIATQSHGPKANKDWPTCLACALTQRHHRRNRAKVPAKCRKCFEEYCA